MLSIWFTRLRRSSRDVSRRVRAGGGPTVGGYAGHTDAAAPPARWRACSESARGLTIVSLRIVTKFDDRDHPPSTRAGSSRRENRLGVGTVLSVPGARLCNSINLFIYKLKIYPGERL